MNNQSYTVKTGFRIFGSRNNDKKGVYTTWMVLSWNGDLIYFMYTFMKYPKNPKLKLTKSHDKKPWKLSRLPRSKEYRSVNKNSTLIEKNLHRTIPYGTSKILINDVAFGLKSFNREGNQGNKAFHDLCIHVHDSSNRCPTKFHEHVKLKINFTSL